jgi:hypothetical protein
MLLKNSFTPSTIFISFRSSFIPHLVSRLVKLLLAITCEISYVKRETPVFDIKEYRGKEIRLHPFLTSTIVGAEWSASHAGCVPPAESASSTQ